MRQLSVDDEERRSRSQTRPPVAWIWSGIAVMIVIVAAVLYWVFNLEQTPLTSSVAIEVPELVGQQYEDGAQELIDLGLEPVPFTESTPEIPEGQMAGIAVSPGQDIEVYVSSGAPLVDVPSLTLLTLEQAEAELEERGLVVGTVESENSPNVRPDVVIRTDPEFGAELREGDSVNLVISNGLVTVPDVRGETIGEATSQMSALQLSVTVQGDSSCTGQTVTGQSLAPGDHPQNSAVTLRYCNGSGDGD